MDGECKFKNIPDLVAKENNKNGNFSLEKPETSGVLGFGYEDLATSLTIP